MVEWRIDEQLRREWRAVALTGEQRDGGREVAAGARAADGQPVGSSPSSAAVLGDPAGGGVAVFEAGGKRVLRGAAIRDRDDCAGRLVRKPPTDGVDGIERAEHPASAEDVHEHGERAGGLAAR